MDFVKQSWKKEDKCSHCRRCMWALGLAHRRDVYIVVGASLSLHRACVICVQMLIYHGIMYACFYINSFSVEFQVHPKPSNAFHDTALQFEVPGPPLVYLSIRLRRLCFGLLIESVNE